MNGVKSGNYLPSDEDQRRMKRYPSMHCLYQVHALDDLLLKDIL